MAYWIKTRVNGDYTYAYEDATGEERLNYTVSSYDGPFRTISDVEEYLQDNMMQDAEVIELE